MKDALVALFLIALAVTPRVIMYWLLKDKLGDMYKSE
jgi:hypothetical protein